MIAALAVAVVVIVALAFPTLRHLRESPPPEPAVMRFTIPLPDGVTLESPPMISPDGTRVVFAGGGALYVRPLDALAAERLPATEDARDARAGDYSRSGDPGNLAPLAAVPSRRRTFSVPQSRRSGQRRVGHVAWITDGTATG